MIKPKKVAKTDNGVFNLLSRGASFTAAVRQTLAENSARLKSTPGILYGALASNTKLIIPIMDFCLAWCLNTKGFLSGRIMDIIGADGVGKTSLVFTIFGWAIRFNIPCAHVETEGKPMDADRIRRCLHTNRELSDQMFNTVSYMQAFEIVDAVNKIESWLRLVRDKKFPDSYVPDHIPAIVCLDTFSKLMAPAEAVGYGEYAEDEEDKKTEKSKEAAKSRNKERQKKIQELGTGSNMGHAKLAHAWSRRLPSLLSKYNAFLILVRHQNEKVEMNSFAGGGSFIPAEVKEQWNRESIGGRAFAQSAAYELVITPGKPEVSVIRGDRVRVSQGAKISIAKNSYGPARDCSYKLNLVPRGDTEELQDPVIDFSPSLPDILKAIGLVKITIKGPNEVSCPDLGIEDNTPKELSEALHKRQDMVDDLCLRLGLVASGPNFKHPPLNSIFVSEETKDPASSEAPAENAEKV
jgi:hypothetical protein